MKHFRIFSVLFIVLALGTGTILAQDDYGLGQLDNIAANSGNGAATRVEGTITLTLFGGPGCSSPTGLCSTGTASGGLNGTIFTEVTSFKEGRVFNRVTGNTTITTADGQLITRLSGRIAVADGTSNTKLKIIDGTGIYQGARGMILNEGTLDPATGVETVMYRGVVVSGS